MSKPVDAVEQLPVQSDLTRQVVDADIDHQLRPFIEFDSFREGALPIERAEGAYIWDTNGNRYLDAVGGMWCTNIGAGRKEMAEAIAQQVLDCSFANPLCRYDQRALGTVVQKTGRTGTGRPQSCPSDLWRFNRQ